MKIPSFNGVGASTLVLPTGPWQSLLDALCARFPNIERAVWVERMQRGRVLDAQGLALGIDTRYQAGQRIHYFREVQAEPAIPFEAKVVYQDEHILVADKPHFLPVMPAGQYVEQTLLARLSKQLNCSDLVPLHRIDRHTAGLVMFSLNPDSRDAYHGLFRDRLIRKVYEAWAPALPDVQFPLCRKTRLVAGEPFIRMQEAPGEANSETQMHVLARGQQYWLYQLEPITGRKHQLRVQMAGLGAAICNDTMYPLLADAKAPDDYERPLKLLARHLFFTDPVSAHPRVFSSELSLPEPLA